MTIHMPFSEKKILDLLDKGFALRVVELHRDIEIVFSSRLDIRRVIWHAVAASCISSSEG
jgi:hypothetical protein